MFKKKFVYMFPSTFTTKNVVAPFNRKLMAKMRVSKIDGCSGSLKKDVSRTDVALHELNKYTSDNRDFQQILLETGKVLIETTNSTGVNVYMVDENSNELFLLTGKRYYVTPTQYRFPMGEGKTIAAHVAFHKEYVLLTDIQNDPRFPLGLGPHNSTAESVLCVPVVTPDSKCVAVLELFKDNFDSYSKEDLKIIIVVTGWMGAAINQNHQKLQMERHEIIHDHLLDLTLEFVQERSGTTEVISNLVGFAKARLNALRGSFYVVDKDCEELTADRYEEGLDAESNLLVKKNLKVKLFEKDRGVTTLVARTGYTVNIKDPYKDQRLGKEPEIKSGNTINSILCMPINGAAGLLGIYRLLNKKIGVFTKEDEEILKICSTYAACCLQFNTLQIRMRRQEAFSKIYMDLLNIQLKPCSHEYEYALSNINAPLCSAILDFRWYIPDAMLNDAPQFAVNFIRDLSAEGEMNLDQMTKFILLTRKMYRANAYHNFEHAFNFMHCMYNILRRNKDMFTTMEIKALLIAAICHDIDHGGYTNNFLVLTNHVVYQLYSESPWENYHYMITVQLLERSKIFKSMDPENYKAFLKEIKEAILATDLVLYFKNRRTLLPIVNDNVFELSNSNHKYLMKTMMMTVCDLSGQCKPFSIARKITENVYKEFYNQGDAEKKLGVPPLSMMDREKQHLIPEDQIQFLTVIVIPATEILKSIIPNTADLNEECMVLRQTWQGIVEEREKKKLSKVSADQKI